MRTLLALVCAISMFVLTPAHATTETAPLSDRQQTLIRVNVIAGLHHPSVEVRASYVQLIIDLKKRYPVTDFNYAILPLMDRLKGDARPEVRILAALALYEFDSELARFAIQRRALYDESDRVARHCSVLCRSWTRRHSPFEHVASLFH